MAGDWIKVENSTPDKPEIFKVARLTGLDTDSVLGKLVRLWRWFDVNSVDGVVDGVVSTDVDALVKHDGFSSALARVGWIAFDDDAEMITLPNFDTHNGETAKKRALKNRRQKKWRENVDKSVDARPSTSASTREEKRREDIYIAPDGLPSPDENTATPSDAKEKKPPKRFQPPTVDQVTEYCAERGNDIDPQYFIDFYQANGWVQGKGRKPVRDWKACVRTWERSDQPKPQEVDVCK